MKKRYDDLTIAEAEALIQCRDENGECLCRKGCKFHFQMSWGGCCAKNMFLSFLFDLCNEKGLLTDESGEWEIDLERSNKNAE